MKYSKRLEDFKTQNCIYVDKTAYFHRLLSTDGDKYFFISRPRRFGKSLMIDALDHILKGHRELFKDMAIDKSNYEWKKWTVFRFDFSKVLTTSFETFESDFADTVENFIKQAGFEYSHSIVPCRNFDRALQAAKALNDPKKENADKSVHEGCAVLIDEYDAPVVHALHNPELAEKIRAYLSNFYLQLKANDDCVKFLMITGVSKFAKLSVFSALSTLTDITFEKDYATMLGFTEEEMTAYFDGHMREQAKIMGLAYDEYRRQFKFWYDGYRFSGNCPKSVYNPVSASLALSSQSAEFQSGWSDTGMSSSVAYLVKPETIEDIFETGEAAVPLKNFNISNYRNIDTTVLLCQTGYLTIKDYVPFDQSFDLVIPNEEVRRNLDNLRLCVLTGQDESWLLNIGVHLRKHKWNLFYDHVRSLVAGRIWGSTEKVLESDFADKIRTVLECCGYKCRQEEAGGQGRADLLAESPDSLFIFEFKVGGTAKDAIEQVKAKNYATQHQAAGKAIYAIGLVFDRNTRQLVDHEQILMSNF